MKRLLFKSLYLWGSLVVVAIASICLISSDYFQIRYKVWKEKGENWVYRIISDSPRDSYNRLSENYNRKCIVSFIDDDSGFLIPDIWGPIIDSTGIKMGFACITGFMSGIEAPEVFRQTSIDTLRSLYKAGHDVYSHSSTHPFFYMDSVNVDVIEDQCRESKEWLVSNGFVRNSNIIVYPGGLGEFRTIKKDIIRKYYEYGVDAGGNGGINAEPLDNWTICRFNADISSLSECISQVEKAIQTGSLLVFMNHAYELNKDRENQINKMISLIRYIQSKGVEIMPLSEALKYKGNLIAEGEYLSSSSHFISNNGVIRCGYSEVVGIYRCLLCIETLLLICGLFILCYYLKKNSKHSR